MPNSPHKVEEAAIWWAENKEVSGKPFVPVLRKRFELKILEAIEAANRAHDIRYGGKNASSQ